MAVVMESEIVAPETRELDTLAAQLAGWLQGQMPQVDGVRVEGLSYPIGAGRSHETILFDAHWTEGGAPVTRSCVVRIKPGGFTVFPDDLFEEQYQIMRAMHAHGAVRVAEPLWIERDPAVLGAPFFIMARVKGRVPVSIPAYSEAGWVFEASVADRRRLWENAVRQMAAIQSVPVSAAPFLRAASGAADGLEQEWEKYLRFVDWVSQDRTWQPLQDCLAKLRAHWPANQPAGIVWGDARIGNMMFDADFNVLAVMDWEQPSLGGALHDLAWWLHMSDKFHGANDRRPHLEGFGDRADTIALWEEATGKSAADIQWYEDFTEMKVVLTGLRMAALKSWDYPTDEALAKRLGV